MQNYKIKLYRKRYILFYFKKNARVAEPLRNLDICQGFSHTYRRLFSNSGIPPHLKRFLQLGVAGNLVRAAHAAAEDVALERGLAVAVDPAGETALGAFRHELLVLGRGGQQIDLAELVILGVHRVHAVDEGLHLAAHFVVIDRRGPADHIGVEHALHDGRHIVLDDARARLLARQAADAELDFLASQRDKLHLMPGGFRALGKLLRHRVAVRARAETG